MTKATPMIIGLDWDGTTNRDMETFEKIVYTLKKAGHKVYIVTMRYPSECRFIPPKWNKIVDGVIPTSREPKRIVTEALGIKIDIWIDDFPEAVTMHARDIWGQASPEGVIVSTQGVETTN